MSDTQTADSETSAISPAERWLVPGLLALVALLQIGLAQTCDLTPWKGGGFGMFASIDGPDMRVIQIDSMDDAGQVRRVSAAFPDDGVVPGHLSGRSRALPTTASLSAIGHALLGAELVAAGRTQVLAVERFRRENPHLTLALVDTPVEVETYRLASRKDSPDIRLQAVRVRAVRLQAWRIRFDHRRTRYGFEAVGDPVVVGPWTEERICHARESR